MSPHQRGAPTQMHMEQTHKHTICYFLNTPTPYDLEMLMNNAQFHYKGIHTVRWIMFTSLISQNWFNYTPQVQNEVVMSLNWHHS